MVEQAPVERTPIEQAPVETAPVEQVIAERIRRNGPITFADFQAAALYEEPDGFFANGGGAGRVGRDFVTSPEVGPLFGALVARALDAAWHRLGAPDPFVVVEVGAGRGRLASDVLRAEPACAGALRYVLVERSARLRDEQRELLTLEPADEALGPFTRVTDGDDASEPIPGTGPIVSSLAELPAVELDGVVLANELLDNLPVRVVQRSAHGWDEVRVGLDDSSGVGRLVEVLVAAEPELAVEADVVAGESVPALGDRLPVPSAIVDWLAGVATMLQNGEVIMIDYADEVAGMLRRGHREWTRTYRGHERGGDPLHDPGSQDITCDVPLGYLRAVAARVGFDAFEVTTQAEWLGALGIEDLVEAGREVWRDRAHLGDLEAIAGRSRVGEAATLTATDGLGAHRVVILHR